MSLQTRLGDLILAVGTDYKQLRTWITGSASGSLTTLTTTDKTSLVNAINEVKASSGSPPPASETVSGLAVAAPRLEGSPGRDTSRFPTSAGARQERVALKAEILGGAGPAFDTLSELLVEIQNAEESSVITALTTTVGTKANTADIYTRVELGNPETDLVAAYTAAKA